jgi:eukaryotic-like serine/threonine-protein kinase
MGVIYRARQLGLDRLCAIKMLRTGSDADCASETQLREEARVAALLDHPNIVGIYDVGQIDGQLFFSMEFVDGENLATFVRTQLLSATRIARYTLKIAEAIQYAHSMGILHCDLKPANILIDHRDEPQITDFGVARRIGRTGGYGKNLSTAGSPNFTAPEQTSARFGEIGPAADVFGIGATLYYLLTDRPPFRGETLEDTLKAVRDRDPVAPRSLRPGVPRDLETICLKCLEKRPSKRYASAQEVADELERFLNHVPIRARKITPVERFGRYARRHPWLTGFATATITLFLLVAIGSPIAAFQINQARRAAEESSLATRRSLYAADMALGFEALSVGNDARVRQLLERYQGPGNHSELRGWEWRFLWSQSRPDDLGAVGIHPTAISRIHLLPTGQLLASDAAYHVKTWDIQSGQLLRDDQPHQGSSVNTFVDPHAKWIALTDRAPQATNNTLRIFELTSWKPKATADLAGFSVVAGAAPDGSAVWVVSTRSISVHSTEDGRLIQQFFLGEPNPDQSFALSPDGKTFARGTASGQMVICDAASGTELARYQAHRANPPYQTGPARILFSPNGRWLASVGGDGGVSRYDMSLRRSLPSLQGHSDAVFALAFSPDSQHLVSAGRDQFIRIWSLSSGDLQGSLRTGGTFVSDIAFLPDGNQFVTSGHDGTLRRWPVAEPPRFKGFTNLPPRYASASFTDDGEHFAWTTASNPEASGGVYPLFSTNSIFRYTGSTNVLATAFCVPQGGPGWAAFYKFGGIVELLSFDGKVARNTRLPDWNTLPSGSSANAGFSADGQALIVSDTYNGVRVFRTSDLTSIRELPGRGYLGGILSADGKLFGAGRVASPPIVGYVATGRKVSLDLQVPLLQSGTFNAASTKVALGDVRGEVNVYETASGRLLHHLHAPAPGLISIAFSRDDTRLAVGGLDGWVCFWDLTSGREIGVFAPHKGPVGAIRFMADGTFISLGTDGHRRWPAPPISEIDPPVARKH